MEIIYFTSILLKLLLKVSNRTRSNVENLENIKKRWNEGSDLPGPAQSREPGQAGPVWAGPGQAIGDGLAMALARPRVAESQSRRLRPGLWSMCVHVFYFDQKSFTKEVSDDQVPIFFLDYTNFFFQCTLLLCVTVIEATEVSSAR